MDRTDIYWTLIIGIETLLWPVGRLVCLNFLKGFTYMLLSEYLFTFKLLKILQNPCERPAVSKRKKTPKTPSKRQSIDVPQKRDYKPALNPLYQTALRRKSFLFQYRQGQTDIGKLSRPFKASLKSNKGAEWRNSVVHVN